MKKKFNKNAKVEKFTNLLGIAIRLIVIDPLEIDTCFSINISRRDWCGYNGEHTLRKSLF